ncbi:uncharacterized protein MONBRDRAFT_33977 [Monosiga brevicollis MX1]|uniref:Uncharacterized protein n=1 Tax=Monosiga brevicollis TaxID=81824 RepID=A9V8W0_MONBE|nr:uncharacterized protein MONBRDRAFT_33977 [Monosiga brevicollis MX1]EDQ85943.1 predicted protein [Monosiga brevicollis MX1]|eukprot:XP_001749137.1 hypothetical protein [Monosiga brevicollis MX1]
MCNGSHKAPPLRKLDKGSSLTGSMAGQMPPERPLCAGWMTKIGMHSGKWQARYFVLTPSALSYFADVGGKYKGAIPVKGVISIDGVRPGAPIAQEACTVAAKRPVGDHAIKITAKVDGNYRSFYLETPSDKDFSIWLKTLQAVKDGKIGQAGGAQQSSKAAPAGPTPTLIPKSEQAGRLDISRQPWWKPKWTEEQAAQVLTQGPEGAFFLTETPNKKHCFTVNLQTGNKVVKLILVFRKQDGRNYWCLGLMFFEHILDFVMHYSRRPINLKAINKRIALSLANTREALAKFKAAQRRSSSGTSSHKASVSDDTEEAPKVKLGPELAAIAQSVKEIAGQIENLRTGLAEHEASLSDFGENINSSRVSAEIINSTVLQALEHAQSRIIDQEERVANMQALIDAGDVCAPDPMMADAVRDQLEAARSQVQDVQQLFDANAKALEAALARAESMVEKANRAVEPAKGMLQPVSYMLELAEKTLAQGGHPGDVKANSSVMLDQAANTLEQTGQSLEQMDYNVNEVLDEVDETLDDVLGPVQGGEEGVDAPVDDISAYVQDNASDAPAPEANEVQGQEGHGDAGADDDDDDDDVIDIMLGAPSRQLDPNNVPAGQIADPTLHQAMTSLSKGDTYSLDADEAANAREQEQRKAAATARVESDEREVRTWIEDCLQRALGTEPLAETLHDGVVLCEVMNALMPGAVSHMNRSKMTFQQMENIGFALSAMANYGLRDEYSFQTVDLFEQQNMPGVINALVHLKSLASSKGFVPETFASNTAAAAAHVADERAAEAEAENVAQAKVEAVKAAHVADDQAAEAAAMTQAAAAAHVADERAAEAEAENVAQAKVEAVKAAHVADDQAAEAAAMTQAAAAAHVADERAAEAEAENVAQAKVEAVKAAHVADEQAATAQP